jgi:hypothetical protein
MGNTRERVEKGSKKIKGKIKESFDFFMSSPQFPVPRRNKQASFNTQDGFWLKIFNTGTPKTL